MAAKKYSSRPEYEYEKETERETENESEQEADREAEQEAASGGADALRQEPLLAGPGRPADRPAAER